uniref:RIKEN cDNA 4930583I09 gene n=1 Tax=Mus spicilegus TaxID=10103 RepID=A0A8C6IFX6_MUSSI
MSMTQIQRNHSLMDTLFKKHSHAEELHLWDTIKNGANGRNFFKVTVYLQSQSNISTKGCPGLWLRFTACHLLLDTLLQNQASPARSHGNRSWEQGPAKWLGK